MPPEFNELPIPKKDNKKPELNDNKIQELLKVKESENIEILDSDETFENSLLKKIKK